MLTAKLIGPRPNMQGDGRIFELSEPHEGYSKVLVSAVHAVYSGPETYIFGIEEDGTIDWGELSGSFRGSLDHEEALKNAGYTIST